jgi:hypothetical protein
MPWWATTLDGPRRDPVRSKKPASMAGFFYGLVKLARSLNMQINVMAQADPLLPDALTEVAKGRVGGLRWGVLQHALLRVSGGRHSTIRVIALIKGITGRNTHFRAY